MGLLYQKVLFPKWDTTGINVNNTYQFGSKGRLKGVPGPKFGREKRYPIVALAIFLSTSRQIPCVFYQVFLSYVRM